MITVRLIAVGRLRSGPLLDLFETYTHRLKWRLDLLEIDLRGESGPHVQARENDEILGRLLPDAPLFALDERGKSLPSPAFARLVGDLFDQGQTTLQFVIGGADGLTDSVRERARTLLSFGHMTWPHMLARVMLAEQLYRAQQILSGHPYHRGE